MHGRGASMAGGHAWQGACVAGEMANVADGTHPTGMHYCCEIFVNKEDKWQRQIPGTVIGIRL